LVFLASHVICSGSSSLQYCLLRILNSTSIEALPAVKLKAQSLEALLERCKDSAFVTSLLNQEKQIDSATFKKLLVEIVGPGSSASQISVLFDLVRSHGPLSESACQQLSIVFPTSGQTTQLQIARLLMNQLEIGPSVFYFFDCSNLRVLQRLLHQHSIPLICRPRLSYRYLRTSNSRLTLAIVHLPENGNERIRHDRVLELFLRDLYYLPVALLYFWKFSSDRILSNISQSLPHYLALWII
jgi:hypothetical protein